MLTRWKSVRKYDPLATVEDGLTSEGMLLLVVVVWETPDEGVVVLADVGVGVLQALSTSPQVGEKNLIWDHLLVRVLRTDVIGSVTVHLLCKQSAV